MPRQGRKTAKSASAFPLETPATHSSRTSANGISSLDYSALKRTELQQQCKKLGLRATGKNAELIERLKSHYEASQLKTSNGEEKEIHQTENTCHKPEVSLTLSDVNQKKEVKTEPSEEKPDVVYGWCVVHGMALYRPPSSWAPLLLQGGIVYIQDENNLVPFHLLPLKNPVPDGFSDNYVCQDCVLRNRVMPKRCPLCQQIQGKGNRASGSQHFSQGQSSLRDSVSQSSFIGTGVLKDRRRTIEIRKLYQPQEDQAYAQRVDGILSQMARGELGMDRALRPLQPLVVHSPGPFQQ